MPARRPAEERFWDRVARSNECWLWTGKLTADGYARFWDGTRMVRAHRFAYELLVGPIADGLTIDHVRTRGCRNRHCVNPAHLEPVTNRVNVLRGDSLQAINARKTHCVRGHEFTSENTSLDKYGGRHCLTCYRDLRRQRRGSKAAPGDLPPGARTHCPRGHPYDDANTYLNGGKRNCKACRRILQREYKQRRARRTEVQVFATGPAVGTSC